MTDHEVLRAANHLLSWLCSETVSGVQPTIQGLQDEFDIEFPDATLEDVEKVSEVILQIIDPRVN